MTNKPGQFGQEPENIFEAADWSGHNKAPKVEL
jgi:hypothetical protein